MKAIAPDEVTGAFECQRAGVASVIAFFGIDFVLLLSVDEARGIEAARD